MFFIWPKKRGRDLSTVSELGRFQGVLTAQNGTKKTGFLGEPEQ
jgi:hypothetical protein